MNVIRLVEENAAPQAEELEAEGRELLAKARERFQRAALCRQLHALTMDQDTRANGATEG